MRSYILTLVIVLMSTAPLWAVAPSPPPQESVRDSASIRWEEGAELTRWIGSARFDWNAPVAVRTIFNSDWITGYSRGQTTDGRVRHDVRWNIAAARNFNQRYGVWGAATGQHYVDRPRSNEQSVAQENRSHLVRTGLGPAIRWNRVLKSAHSLGLVTDSRVDKTESGIGSWNQGEFNLIASAQAQHEAEVKFDYEAPGDRVGSDAAFRYDLRQDYGAAVNQADLAMNWTRREVLVASDVPSQLRDERSLRFSDELNYELAKGATLQGHGNLRYSDVKLDDRQGANSRLEEIESNIKAALLLLRGKSTALAALGIQNATQTVRGEILSGQKVDLSLQGETRVHSTTVDAHTTFSKYSLDTRSADNFDDRDELRWRFETSATTPVMSGVDAVIQGLVDLNHLVYIFNQNSANNRWTRLFLISTRFIHSSIPDVVHSPEFRLSANYQVYDFENNPQQARSTVFRKLTLADNLRWQADEKWAFVLGGEVSREELGRLFWDVFEEERSDRTDYINSSVEVARMITKQSEAALGAGYSRRNGDRFQADGDPRRVLDIESWGPTSRLMIRSDSWFVQGNGQWILQSELGRDQRNFISGSLTAGRTW